MDARNDKQYDDIKPIVTNVNQIVSEFERAFDHRLRRHIFLAKCHGKSY